MPPQIISEDEFDSSSEREVIPTPKTKRKAKTLRIDEEDDEPELQVQSEYEKEEGDDEEDEEVFVVEKILTHIIDEETGVILFRVKWEGYEEEDDLTWETEDNLSATASDILDEYLAGIGGKETIIELWKQKKAKKGKKRGRASASKNKPYTNGAKQSKKNGHPSSTTPPASAKKAEFKPPSGSWEDKIDEIDACLGDDGETMVYLTWKSGNKTKHPIAMVHKRCPQKMLEFYHSHLVFKVDKVENGDDDMKEE